MRTRTAIGGVLAAGALACTSGAAAAPPAAHGSEGVSAPFARLEVPRWTKVDQAFDRAALTPTRMRGACAPRGGPGRTLLRDSKRLVGARLERLVTRAFASPEVIEVDRALNARGFGPVHSGAYGRAARGEKLFVVPYADPLGRTALLGVMTDPNGSRRAEARFPDAHGMVIRAGRPARPGAHQSGHRAPAPKARASVSFGCILNCVRGGARCGAAVLRCRPLLGVPFVGTQLFLACAAASCGPEAIRCIRRCF